MVWVNNHLFVHISYDKQASKNIQYKKNVLQTVSGHETLKFQPTNQNKRGRDRKKYTLKDEYSCLSFYTDKN